MSCHAILEDGLKLAEGLLGYLQALRGLTQDAPWVFMCVGLMLGFGECKYVMCSQGHDMSVELPWLVYDAHKKQESFRIQADISKCRQE